MTTLVLSGFFQVDRLALILMALVTFIGICVGSFAYRYLKGDGNYRAFFIWLSLLIGSVLIMVSADHLVLLLVSWSVSDGLLVRLMIYKKSWRAARASGWLATKNFLLGFVAIASAFYLFYEATGETSIRALQSTTTLSPLVILGLVLLLVGAMIQSAQWPFHRWLISSLNSPTPVSAIMHAGLINGGGFLLVRFSPLYVQSPSLLTLITAIGFVSAWLGTLWKLMQPDVKKMLACSTMGQMGFMFIQCGLGLFPAVVAHLVWHGMFKAYLFLSSGSAAQEKRLDQGYPPRIQPFVYSLACGLLGSVAFALAGGKAWITADTTLVLTVVAFMAGSQFSLPLLQANPLRSLPAALGFTGLAGLVYGGSVKLITSFLAPMALLQPQPLNGFHVAVLVALVLSWLAMLFFPKPVMGTALPTWLLKGYVHALNASQPHPTTVTAHRNYYQY